MFNKKFIIIFILSILYQNPIFSKSISFDDFNSKNLSNYLSGIVAFENKKNTEALSYFNSSRILLNKHGPYLEKYVFSLVLENKVSKAINIVKRNSKKSNSNFFDAYILLILDSLKRNDLDRALNYLTQVPEILKEDRFNFVILNSLKEYIFVFKEKKILKNKKNLGNLSLISETFQRCYLGDENTGSYFLQLTNFNAMDYSRYIYFYITYLIENNQLNDAKNITDKLEYINITLLLSQGKSWIENDNNEKFSEMFSCKNHNDIISEFLFLISNLYSSQSNLEKSNFYLNLSNYLNPKFIFNFSLVAENLYLNENYDEAKNVLKNFNQDYNFYYWYRIKRESQIIEKQENKNKALNFIEAKFKKIKNPNDKVIFDIANTYKNSQKYDQAIKLYTQILINFSKDSKIRSDLLYRRGASYERLKNFEKADKDLIDSLKINPDDAYVLNYLAYSWLERDYKIDQAIEMLEKAYENESNDPYIIDSIGWAYYLINDFQKAEIFLKRAVELMPDDPTVNDHYGDILWKLDRKIQARYFWKNVLKMKNVDEKLINKISYKLIQGIKSS